MQSSPVLPTAGRRKGGGAKPVTQTAFRVLRPKQLPDSPAKPRRFLPKSSAYFSSIALREMFTAAAALRTPPRRVPRQVIPALRAAPMSHAPPAVHGLTNRHERCRKYETNQREATSDKERIDEETDPVDSQSCVRTCIGFVLRIVPWPPHIGAVQDWQRPAVLPDRHSEQWLRILDRPHVGETKSKGLKPLCIRRRWPLRRSVQWPDARLRIIRIPNLARTVTLPRIVKRLNVQPEKQIGHCSQKKDNDHCNKAALSERSAHPVIVLLRRG